MYKYIFLLFHVSLIFPTFISSQGRKKHSTTLRNFYIVFNVFITVYFVSSMSYSVTEISSPMLLVANIAMTCMVASYRWIICVKLYYLKRFVKLFDYSTGTKQSSVDLWIYIWLVLNFILKILVFIFHALTLTNYTDSLLFFGFELVGSYNTLYYSSYSLYMMVFFLMPINTFALFYTVTCYEMQCKIRMFLNYMPTKISTSYSNLLNSYNKLASDVKYIDNQTSFLVFCNTLFNSMIMYVMLDSILHADTRGTYYIALIRILFFNTFLSFLAMTVSASLVSEVAADIAYRSRSLTATTVDSALCLQRFVHCTEKGLGLTVWKIAPIRRNFIIGVLGVIFTYTILLDSLRL